MAWLVHSLESDKKQPMEFDGFGTRGYMLYLLGCTVEY